MPSPGPSPIPLVAAPRAAPGQVRWVPETRFGRWFLGTAVWERYVVATALQEFGRLWPAAARRPRVILDAGSGPGVSLPLLDRMFAPERIIAIDADPGEVVRSRTAAGRCQCPAEVRQGDVARLDLADGSVDLVLCHQTLHHVVRQEEVLAEFFRVLAPGGALLLAESCREFIHSTPVRLLFRHPDEVQRSAEEYQQMVRAAGFTLEPAGVTASSPFWSRPDWGLTRRLGLRARGPEEPTQITLVALRRREG